MEDKKQQTEETLRSIFGGSVDTIGSNDDMSKSIQLNAPDTTPIIAESPVVAGGDNLNINVNVTQNLIQREVERAVNSILETTSNPADIKKNYTDEYQAGNSSVTQSNFFESSPPPSSVLSGIPINNSFVNNFTNNAVTNPVYDTRTTVSRSLSPINTTQANTSIAGSPPSTLNMQSPMSVNVDENITDNTTTVNTAPQEGQFFIENAPGNLSSFEARSRLTDDSNPNYLKFDLPEQADDAALKLESANRLMEQTKHLNLTDRQREIMQERPELFDRYMYYTPPGPDNWVDRGNGFRENLTLPDQSPNLPSPEKIQKTIESGDREALKVLLDNHFGQFGTSDNNPVWRKYGDFNGGDVTSTSASMDRAREGNDSENKARVNLNKATESQSAYITPTEDARLLAEFYGLDYYFNFAGDSDYLLATKSTGTQRNATKDKNEDGTVEKNTSSKLNRLPTANITPISSLPTYLNANVPEKTQSQTYNPGSYDAVEKIRSGRGFGANDSNRPISSEDMPEDVIGDANTNVSFKPVYIQNDNGSTVLIPRESDRTRVPVSPEPPQPSPPESPTTVNNIDNSVVDNSVNVSNTNISSNILPGTPASMIAQLTMATTSTTNATDDKTVAISPPAEGEFFIENAPGNLSSNEAKSRLTDDSNPNYLKFDSPEQADDAASRLEAGNKLLEQYKDTELTDRQREILQQYPHLFANTDQYNGRERKLYIPQPDEIADEIARGDTEYLSQMLGDHLESYGTSNNNPIWKKYRDFGAGRNIAGGVKLRATDGDEATFVARTESTGAFVAETEEANALAEFYGLPKRFSNDPTNPDTNLPYMMVQAVRGSIDSQTTTASNETKTNENYTSNPTANITQLAELPSLINSTSRSPIIGEPGSYDDVENIRAGANYGANNPIRRPDMSKVGDGNPDVGYNPVYIRNPDGTIRRQEYDTPSPEPSPPQAPIDLQGVESNYTQILSPDDSVNAIGVENNYNVMQSPMSVSTDQNITNNNTSETNLNIIAGSPAAMISQLAFATIQNESSYVNPNSPEARINNTSVTNTSSYVNPNSPEARINNTSVTNTSSYVNPNSPEGRVRTPPVTNTSSYVDPNSPEGRVRTPPATNTSATNTSSYVDPNSPEGRINNTSESSTPQEPIDLQGVEENYSVLQTNTNDTTNEVNSNVDSMSYLNNSIIDNSNVSNDGLVSNVSNVLGDTNVSTINQTTSNTQQTNTNVNHNINNNQISSNEVNNMLLSQYSNMNYIASTYNQSTNKTSSDSYSAIRYSDNTNLHANINSNKTTFESVSYNPSSINENITKILNNSIGDNYSSAISTISKSSNMDFTHNIKNIIQQLIMENESRKEQEEENKQMNASPISEMMVGESEIEEQDLKDFEPAETTNINDYMLVSDPDLSMFIKNINSPPVWRTVLS